MRTLKAFTVIVFVSFGCSSESSGGASGGASNGGGSNTNAGTTAQAGHSGSAGSSATAEGPTWSEQIAPIVFRECVGCHREGGIAPFSLTSYASAAKLADDMAEEVEGRFMPPMPVDNSGSCNTYSNARWLSEAEIALIRAWATAGAPEGDKSKLPELPGAPEGLTNPSATLDMGEEYTPNAALADDYRCFVIDAPFANDTFLVGYQVLPGDPRVVHHAIVYQPNDDAAANDAIALDAAEPGMGYTCFGGPGVDADPRVLWAPGAAVITLPTDTGLPMAAGRKLVLQVHYNLSAGAFPDRTRVLLATTDKVAHAAMYLAAADTKMSVAVGQAEGTTTRTLDGTNKPIVLWGALPHMHTLGRKLHVDATSGSGSSCLVNVDRWDFHWQNAWWYSTPLTLDTFKDVTISCSYDTRGREAPVTWGEGTSDEMCLSYFYATAP